MNQNPALTYAIWIDLAGKYYGGTEEVPGRVYHNSDEATREANRLHREYFGQFHNVRVFELDARACTLLDYRPREYLVLKARLPG